MPDSTTIDAPTATAKGTADPSRLLSVDEVCRILGITQHTFYAYRKRYRGFRTVTVGNRTYMRPERLDAFLRELEEQQA